MKKRREDLGAEFEGPIERGSFADKLQAQVISPGGDPRIHGYSVREDLGPNYTFDEISLLGLTGELPDDGLGEVLDLVLRFLAPAAITRAPTHAAVIARLCDAAPGSVLGAGIIGLVEQATQELDRYRGWLTWLEEPVGETPSAARATDPDDLESARALRRLVERRIALDLPRDDLSLIPVALAALRGCGLVTAEQMLPILVFARIPGLASEAFAATPRGLMSYPLDTPPFRYEEEDEGAR